MDSQVNRRFLHELEYLHFNIFGLALSYLATGSGSLNKRLAKVHSNYFYKVNWEKDLQLIPNEYKGEFLMLKKLLWDDVNEAVQKQRKNFQENFRTYTYSKEELGYMSNAETVIKSMDWRKAKKVAELISSLYFGLGYVLD